MKRITQIEAYAMTICISITKSFADGILEGHPRI